VAVPAGVPALEVGAALGLVIGRTACRVAVDDALDHVAGLVIVADLSVPHDSFYRPSVRLKARDGFCPIGPQVWPLAAVASPDAWPSRVAVDGQVVHRPTTGDRIRRRRAAAGRRQRLHDAGARRRADAGRVGRRAAGGGRARRGHRIEGLGTLSFTLVPEAA
jgi:5-oxopent-3-ene-1,2,5-tricarboxylate decarboxylase/2-hydroxyhepta-2,4-diene-1,7-dioate isomerase